MNIKQSSLDSHLHLACTPHPTVTEVMDVFPWPNGYGFAGSDSWWQRVLSQSDFERLDNLIGLALLDHNLCERLVVQRDRSLMSSFGLPEHVQNWLLSIKASTLKDFAEAIMSATNTPFILSPEAI